MIATHASPKLVYFGKLPSRGDFLRSSSASTPLVQTLDRWMSRTMELLANDPRWKQVYDEAPTAQFAFLGPRSPVGLAGHLMPSQDASGRRYPFIVAGSFDVAEPANFLGLSPLALSGLWTRLENASRLAQACEDAQQIHEVLAKAEQQLDHPPLASTLHFREFLETQTLGSLETLLEEGGQPLPLRQALLALGLLLQPLLTHSTPRLERGLLLPLVKDPLYRPFIATFWLDLLVGFVRRSSLELGIFVTRSQGMPVLVVGFNGACPRSLRSVLDPQSCTQDNIEFSRPTWVERSVDTDYGLKKLSSYLRDPQLSLGQACLTFRETFLGA
jgi:type VI secretion system protein ImpM